MTSLHFKTVWSCLKRTLKNLPFSDAKTFCSYSIWPKNVNASRFYRLLQEKKKYGWKILSEGWYFKQDHSTHLGLRSGKEGGGRVPYEIAHFGPAHYLISLIGMKAQASGSFQLTPRLSTPLFWQGFLALELVTNMNSMIKSRRSTNLASFTRPNPPISLRSQNHPGGSSRRNSTNPAAH